MLRESVISFPGFGIKEFTVNSVAFSLFGKEIAWYAIIITCGMIAAVAYATLMAKKIGIPFEDVLDFAIWTIPIGIIGARLYYVIFDPDKSNYDSFVDVIALWDGGLGIYGGIIAGALTVLVVSHIKKINFFAFADCVAPGVLLAQGIGRWGNFMNGEAYGATTEIFCRMGLQNINTLVDFKTIEMVYVHPTFLYESLWNILGFVFVNLFAKYIHKRYDGQLFLLIFGWYGLGRMFIEMLRTDSLYIGAIRVSSLLGGLIFAACAGLLVYFAIKKPAKPLYRKAVANGNNTKNAKKGR